MTEASANGLKLTAQSSGKDKQHRFHSQGPGAVLFHVICRCFSRLPIMPAVLDDSMHLMIRAAGCGRAGMALQRCLRRVGASESMLLWPQDVACDREVCNVR